MRCRRVASDARFDLFELVDTNEEICSFRKVLAPYLARQYPAVSFEAKTGEGIDSCDVVVICNKAVVNAVSLTTDWRTFSIVIPEDYLTPLDVTEVFWQSVSNRPWLIRNVTFGSAESEAEHAAENHPLAADLKRRGFYDPPQIPVAVYMRRGGTRATSLHSLSKWHPPPWNHYRSNNSPARRVAQDALLLAM